MRCTEEENIEPLSSSTVATSKGPKIDSGCSVINPKQTENSSQSLEVIIDTSMSDSKEIKDPTSIENNNTVLVSKQLVEEKMNEKALNINDTVSSLENWSISEISTNSEIDIENSPTIAEKTDCNYENKNAMHSASHMVQEKETEFIADKSEGSKPEGEVNNNKFGTIPKDKNTVKCVVDDENSCCQFCMKDPYFDILNSDGIINDYGDIPPKIKMIGRDYYGAYKQFDNKEPHRLYLRSKVQLPKGAILHFYGVSDKVNREEIKEELTKLGADIAFIDFQRGWQEGWVRLTKTNAAREFLGKINTNVIRIAGTDMVFRALGGNEQRKYLKYVSKVIIEHHQDYKSLNRKLRKNGYKYVKHIN